MNKKELTYWGISVVIALVLMLLILFLDSMHPKGIDGLAKDARNYMSAPSHQAQVAAHQENMSGSALLVKPAVVCICTTGVNAAGDGFHLKGIGSGVIIHPNGFILTSDLSYSGNDDIKVMIYEPSHLEGQAFELGHEHIYSAQIVSSFPAAGLCVLKIEGINLPTARLGNSNDVQKGDWCITVGNTLGQKPVVTSGIVTALNQIKKINGITYRRLMETNCKGGRSMVGGSLINKWGEIIGIVIDKGFVVPSSKAMMILDGLGITLGIPLR